MQKIKQLEFIEQANLIHNNFYDYSKINYINYSTKVLIHCHQHGDFWQSPRHHVYFKHGCLSCGKEKAKKNKTYSFQEWLDQSNKIHDFFYDYSQVNFIDYLTPVTIICPIHQQFSQKPKHHLYGEKGCTSCALQKRDKNRTWTTQQFIDQANLIHNYLYDYSTTTYSSYKEKVNIKCKKHNIIFSQSATNHLGGHGCPACGKERQGGKYNTLIFIEKSQKIHGKKYDYSKVNYIDAYQKVEIICPDHKSFWQRPTYHLTGSNCPTCANLGVSEAETQWLNSLNIKNRQYHTTINNKKYIFDGFDPNTNTVYEYNGDYWHGNPQIYSSSDVNKKLGETYGQLYQQTIDKENAIKNAGYNLIVKWTTDIIDEWKYRI